VKQRQRLGQRYLAGLAMALALLFLIVGTLGPAHRSPYYWLIVPPPALIAFFLGSRAWSSDGDRSTRYSAAALILLVVVLVFSHLLPRSTA
jgi:hypothetical protein